MRSATKHARGCSIIVPISGRKSVDPESAITRSTRSRRIWTSCSYATSGSMISMCGGSPPR
jgi:hypothetical protein